MKKLVINFKAYQESTGASAVELARKIAGVSSEVILCPQYFDIKEIAGLGNPVYAQHVDALSFGSRTGWIVPEAVKAAGAVGTLINHSEHTVGIGKAGEAVKRCREAKVQSLVCVPDVAAVVEAAKLEPDMIAIEPPELIGSGISVSQAQPKLIEEAVESAGGVTLLCGAGVSTAEDVKKAVGLGAEGVLVASAIVKSPEPEKLVGEMVKEL
ncbi:MAG: triose-phosphate isomerase [Candidatus Diapherotrites archaeon]|nr:triose-phosphate isomerase [Candidatus Diapherotrites archaeon]